MRKKQIKVLVTDELHQSLQTEAKAMNMKLATYVAWLLMRRNHDERRSSQQNRRDLQRLMDIF